MHVKGHSHAWMLSYARKYCHWLPAFHSKQLDKTSWCGPVHIPTMDHQEKADRPEGYCPQQAVTCDRFQWIAKDKFGLARPWATLSSISPKSLRSILPESI